MRLNERVARLYNEIEELKKRIAELEKKEQKIDQIGFSLNNDESFEFEQKWDDTPSVEPTHWEGE